MRLNMTIETKRLSVDDIAKIVAGADCSSRCDCINCPLLSPVTLKNEHVETTCMSLFIATNLNVNKL